MIAKGQVFINGFLDQKYFIVIFLLAEFRLFLHFWSRGFKYYYHPILRCNGRARSAQSSWGFLCHPLNSCDFSLNLTLIEVIISDDSVLIVLSDLKAEVVQHVSNGHKFCSFLKPIFFFLRVKDLLCAGYQAVCSYHVKFSDDKMPLMKVFGFLFLYFSIVMLLFLIIQLVGEDASRFFRVVFDLHYYDLMRVLRHDYFCYSCHSWHDLLSLHIC